ncbi:MAG: patatin-like phospholipase family protein [Firmicutes bacterium]|nr:patatin-like phospholipase family protein [Bacillota bacterium]
MKKIGLALGAGGARGFCHIGVIEVLLENNIPIDVVTGCSMGAVVGGGFVAGVSCETMRAIANQTTNRRVFDFDIFNIKSKGGVARGDRAMKIYKHYIGDKLIEECEIPFMSIATDLRNRELYEFRSGYLWRAIRASMAIPGVFHPVEHEDRLLVDGGVLKRIPIQQARDLGADIVIAVDALGPPKEMVAMSALKVIDMAYQIIDWKTAQYEARDADIMIVPDLGNKSSFKFKDNDAAIMAGREAAEKMLPQILAALGRN